ncbi:hypothetical protein FGO68_gene3143 [Halteria grandinella]|uniref:Uncharacterized protein n=1 Tax=Halteria grandinella TaxID=5974 RepID=A0A8J8NQU5_HALGN|nr:hypothetical protein FGO68_gene3143 [Halteria grandinella]
MQLQKQDYVAAERIQRELMIRLPGDPVITEFSKFLPAEALAQKNAANEYGDEYYDEEDEGKDKAAEKEEEEEEEPEEEETEEPTIAPAEPILGADPQEPATANPDKKEGDSEYEDEDDGYGEEDYDEEGRYKWGQEGNDWDWYYREDKEAYERGDPMPNTLNPPVLLDKETIERAVEAKQRMESASTQASSTKENSGAGMYRTHNRKRQGGGGALAAPRQGAGDIGEWKH